MNGDHLELRCGDYAISVRVDPLLPPDEVRLEASELAASGSARVTVEYGLLMSGGAVQVRPSDPKLEAIYPLREWLQHRRRHGEHALRREVVVLSDWKEVDDVDPVGVENGHDGGRVDKPGRRD